MSLRRVVSGGDVRVVFQDAISSDPSSFAQFDVVKATCVDKSLAIEAFLRDRGAHHLVLRPRRCGKSYTLSMIRLSFSDQISAFGMLMQRGPSGTFCSVLGHLAQALEI
jgi:hypothetical protein